MNRRSMFLLCSLHFCCAMALAQMPALSPLPKTGSISQPDDPNKFVFIVAGDNRPAKPRCPQPPTPGKIFAAVKQMNPTPGFVIWTGDTISGKNPQAPKVMHKQYHAFLKIASMAGVPIFNAPGNHEMDDATNAPSSTMKKLYREDMAQTYGAFNYGNSRFIALDSENEPSGAAKVPTTAEGQTKVEAPGAITKKQLDLLKKDLDDNKDKAHIIIFMHHPVMPYEAKDGLDEASVKALEKLFKDHGNVSYVVSGHEHMYFNPLGPKDQLTDPPKLQPGANDPKPPYYLVSGGAGAPLKKHTPGSFFHYLVFQVDGDTITPTLIKVDSSDTCDK